MISPKNKRKELEHILLSRNFVTVANGIKTLRNEPPFTGAIGLLVSYYDKVDDIRVRKIIKEFMNDLKDQHLSDEVISVIKNDLKPETIRMVISSCWQSGLDYSAYAADFADIFLTADYMTAVECLSVIESSAGQIPGEKKNEIVSFLNKRLAEVDDEKKGLVKELIAILEKDVIGDW